MGICKRAYHCGPGYMVLAIKLISTNLGDRQAEYIEELLTLPEVRRNYVDLDIGSDETHAGRLISVDAAKPGAEVAVPQVRVRLGALLGSIDGAEKLVAGYVVVQQEGRCEVKRSSGALRE